MQCSHGGIISFHSWDVPQQKFTLKARMLSLHPATTLAYPLFLKFQNSPCIGGKFPV